MAHVRVWVDGVDVTALTLAELSIAGGRRDKLSRPEPATAGIRIEWPASQPLPRFGSRVDVAGWPNENRVYPVRALFTGTVTDLAWEDGWLSLLAVDPMRVLDGLPVGDTPWPAQNLTNRIATVWNAARAAAGTPAWMRDGYDMVRDADLDIIPAGKILWAARDVDRQPALELLHHYLDPIHAGAFLTPHQSHMTTVQEPSTWTARTHLRHGLAPWVPATNLARVPATMILADPPLRRWQGITSIVNDWTIEGIDPDTPDEQGLPTAYAKVARDPASVASYGPRASRYRTEILNKPLTDPAGVHAADYLAGQLLDRTSLPAWNVDNVTVLFTADTPPADAIAVWELTRYGPGAVGTYVELEAVIGSTRLDDGYYGWVIESQDWRWTLDGWELDLNLSDLGLYTGALPPYDWRNIYAELRAAHPTYPELRAAHPTYAAITAATHPHPQEA